MRQLEFSGKMLELVAEWMDDYKRQRSFSDEPENWPYERDQEDWMSDFFVWLQCKGYSL